MVALLMPLGCLIKVGSLLRLVVWQVFSATDQIIRRSRHGLQFKNRCQNVAERQQHTCIELSLAVSSIKPWWFVRHISASQSAQCLHVMQVSKYDCFPFNIPFFLSRWLFLLAFYEFIYTMFEGPMKPISIRPKWARERVRSWSTLYLCSKRLVCSKWQQREGNVTHRESFHVSSLFISRSWEYRRLTWVIVCCCPIITVYRLLQYKNHCLQTATIHISLSADCYNTRSTVFRLLQYNNRN